MTVEMEELPELEELSAEDQETLKNCGEELDKSVLFISVINRRFLGYHKVREATVSVGKTELSTKITTSPRWNLIPDEWRKRFAVIDSEIHSVINSASAKLSRMQCPLRGVHVIPRTLWPELNRRLDRIEKEKLIPLATQFAEAFPAIKDTLMKEINDLDVWKTVEERLPAHASDIVSRFKIEKVTIPIKLSEGNMETWSSATADEMAEVVKDNTKSMASMVAQGLIAELQGELFEAVDNLVTRINEKGIVKGALLTNLKNAFEKLQAFDFVKTPELKKKMNEVKGLIDSSTFKDLNLDIKNNTNKLSGQLLGVLKEVRDQAEIDISVEGVYGKGRRQIRI